ncbi:MAG: GNAT family protein [Bacteroidota bacterium]
MFDFKAIYQLKNDVVELIPLQITHLDALFAVSNDKNIWTHFTENGYGRANFEIYFKNALQKRENHLHYTFAIRDVRTNQLAGMTRLYDLDNQLRNVKIGHTWIGKSFQGTGLNKNAKYLLFEFLFDQLKMQRIGFGASAANTVSIKAMQSVGCQIEGRLRSFLPQEGTNERIDIVLLSILKKEWEVAVKQRLYKKINPQ